MNSIQTFHVNYVSDEVPIIEQKGVAREGRNVGILKDIQIAALDGIYKSRGT